MKIYRILFPLKEIINKYVFTTIAKRVYIFPLIQVVFPVILLISYNLKDNEDILSLNIEKEIMKIFFYSLKLNKEIICSNREFSSKWFELFKLILDKNVVNNEDNINTIDVKWKIRKWILYIINKIHLSFSHRKYISIYLLLIYLFIIIEIMNI